ncbi:acyl-[acyl-carrier-protein] thioesterase [Acetivibrio straminisolvens]|jgi:acyl-ACP thioesterase|uniref:Acyl-ACP thioesterase n=1 Tax=Acetivibrio straminisolvens JCM 21531 TaxID=1294263 RepID=W4VAM5_9FIRM|nr:acyl-ACP thioesterase domain-containing protein [Acetivibrio straminisolvens]GAE90445.1 acyl-ACP thioesterase [Acetivibrio straminisolvens JCM 21531]
MQKKRFSKEYEVHYYEINAMQELTLLSLLNYLEDCAISHSASAGYGVNELKAADSGWVLNRWSLKIDRFPRLREKITVETWASSFERFYGYREFFITDSSNKTIVKASSVWIYFNIKKRRPMRIPLEMGDAYGIDEAKALEEPFADLDFDFEPEVFEEFPIKRSDIDTNNHVNNKKYVDWIMETVPQQIYDNYKVASLQIMYKKEASLGSVIRSGCIIDWENTDAPQLRHKIWDKDTGLELASAETIWQKIVT